jgi:phosphate transport system ATP-binding protein
MHKLEIRNASLAWRGKAILNQIQLGIPRNAITAIMGHMGSGKSSLLKLFNRMNDPADGFTLTGEVLLDGKNIYRPEIDVMELRQQIVLVLPNPVPFPFSIAENVIFGLRLRQIRDQKYLDDQMQRALYRTGLWDETKNKLQMRADELSLAQQMRLSIARALALEPGVLLLDEPTDTLDPASADEIEHLIRSLSVDHTIVMATRSSRQAARLSDRTAYLEKGYLIEFDDTKNLFTNPAVEQTLNFITGRFNLS